MRAWLGVWMFRCERVCENVHDGFQEKRIAWNLLILCAHQLGLEEERKRKKKERET